MTLRVTNLGLVPLRVRHTASVALDDVVEPGQAREYTQILFGHFKVDHVVPRRRSPRFDPQGGDPYNRVGPRAVRQ